jgi:N-methylhydantoinase A
MSVEVARRLGRPNLLSFDMGGTTAKVGQIRDWKPAITSSFNLGSSVSAGHHGEGETIRIPVIDLAEVGSGGGSIAWVDDGGFLHVGPQSAGADPGPACYGRGGTEATVTDADLVLGYIDPASFLGGRIRIDVERSRGVIATKIAERLDVDVLAAAYGIHELANAHMGAAVRVLTVQRGIDPREFAVTALGGAGPVHIARVAEQFAISTIVVPPSPGVASAYGLLTTDVAYDFVRNARVGLGADRVAGLQHAYDEMEAAARAELRSGGRSYDEVHIERTAKMHFEYQAGQLAVAFPTGPISHDTVKEVEEGFRDLYAELYHVRPEDRCVFVNVGVRVVGVVPKPPVSAIPQGQGGVAHAGKGERAVCFTLADGYTATPVYDRARLRAGDHFDGPAIVEEAYSTIVCPPGYEARIDGYLHVVLTAAG